MQCNIDAQGKAIRLIAGAAVEGIGCTILVLVYVGIIENPWAIGGGVAALALGLFMIVQSLAGWCAIRAMSFRTPF